MRGPEKWSCKKSPIVVAFFGQMRVFSELRPDLHEKIQWPACRCSKALSLAFGRADFGSVHKKGMRMMWEESTDPASSANSSNPGKDFRGPLAYLLIVWRVPAPGGSSPVLGEPWQTLRSWSISDGVEEIGEKSFFKSETVSHVNFGESSLLRRIGLAAFYGSRLEYIHIPDLVEDIGDLCFSKCEHLSRVTFGETSSLKRIGYGAFFSCSLKQIHIPKSLERLDCQCFCGCASLTRVTFEEPSSLKYIGIKAFAECAMREIRFPDSVEEISDTCFSGCKNLVRAVFGESSLLKRIGNDAFYGCSLREISIPDSVEEIGTGCFSGCPQFACIKFGEHSSLKSIGGGCFRGSSVVEFSLPKSVVSIGGVSCEKMSPDCGYTFRLYDDLMLADDGRICYSLGLATTFSLPDTVEYLCDSCNRVRRRFSSIDFTKSSSLKRIGVTNFFGAWVASVAIPETVEELGSSCFHQCSRLRTVTFGQSATVRRIGFFAFSQCKELEEIEIPQTVRTIDEGCFYMCNKLRRVKFCAPSVLEVIGRLAFFGCHLEEVSIPDTVIEIGDECFYMCLSLSRVTFGESPSLKRIGTRAFSGCPLRRISIPGSVEEICDECFYKCKALSRVNFGKPSSLTSVGANAFSQLSMVKLPDGITVKEPTRQIVRLALIGSRGSGKKSIVGAYTGPEKVEAQQFCPFAGGYSFSVEETFNEETYELHITLIDKYSVMDQNHFDLDCFLSYDAFDVFIFVDTAEEYVLTRGLRDSLYERLISRFPDGQRLFVRSMADLLDQSQRPCTPNLHIPYIECSAKTGENIREVFLTALELYLKFPPEPRNRCEVS